MPAAMYTRSRRCCTEMLAGEPPHTGASCTGDHCQAAHRAADAPSSVARHCARRQSTRQSRKRWQSFPRTDSRVPEISRGHWQCPECRNGLPARSRRWVPIAIGGAVAAVAAVALILAGKPAERLQPERIQLTVTGRAYDPSFSPDSARIAFVEKQCDGAGYCTFQLVIQDTDGQHSLPIARNLANSWRTAWTPNGAYIVFVASYGPERWGVFGISTLGGTPRLLGRTHPGGFDFGAGDTVFIVPRPADDAASGARKDSIRWVRRITVHDGQTLDSIRVRDPVGFFTDVVRLPYPGRLLLAVANGASTVRASSD